MKSRRAVFTPLARADVEAVLEYTATEFGLKQLDRYASYIDRAVQRITAVPESPGSFAREELGSGVRCFHLDLVAGRRGAASHFIYYVVGALSDTEEGVIVLRVLHDSMEPRRRVLEALGKSE